MSSPIFLFDFSRRLIQTASIAHEAAAHTARLRVELSQSRTEQKDYLKNVELARVLDKRATRKRERDEKAGTSSEVGVAPNPLERSRNSRPPQKGDDSERRPIKKRKTGESSRGAPQTGSIDDVLAQVF